MSSGSKRTDEERIAALQEVQAGKDSYSATGEIVFVNISRTNKKYSAELTR